MAFSVSYVYEILDRYSQPLRRINRNTQNFGRTIARTKARLVGMSNKLRSTGERMSSFSGAVGAAGATLALRNMINVSSEFEAALNKVESVTGATAKGMFLLEQQALKLGRQTQFSAVQSAQAMTFLGMAGLNTQEILSTMPGMLDLAAAGGMQLADAANHATNILQAFGLPLENIGHLSDVLAKAAASSNTSVMQLAGAMRNVAPTAHLAGVGLEETTSMLMILANAGIQGEEAGTQVMNAFRALASMTPKAAKALAKLGINPRGLIDTDGKIKDVIGLIDTMGKRGATLGEFFKIFDIRGAKAMAVLSEAGATKLTAFTKDLVNSEGAAKKMAQILMKGLPGAAKRFESVLEGLKLKAAETIKPMFIDILQSLTAFMMRLQEGNPELLKWGVIAIVVTGALAGLTVVVGLLMTALSGLIALIAAITWPITLIVAGAIALTMAFRQWVKNNHPVIQGLRRLWDALQPVRDVFGWLMHEIMGTTKETGLLTAAFTLIGHALNVVVTIISAALRVVFSGIKAFLQFMSGDFKGASDTLHEGLMGIFGDVSVLGESFEDLGNIVANIFQGISDWVSKVWTDVKGFINAFGSAVSSFGSQIWEGGITPSNIAVAGAMASSEFGKSAAETTASQQAAVSDIKANGQITVKATPGAEVTSSNITLNEGSNLATAY